MPLQSHEVLTLRLIFDCDDDFDEDQQTEQASSDGGFVHFLLLPSEIRREILRNLLLINRNRKPHTRRPPKENASTMLWIQSHRILEAPPFKHKGSQEINGCPPVINTCQIYPAILKACRQLYEEGKTVLYAENTVIGLQCGIKGLNAKFRNYGIPMWGSLSSYRLAATNTKETQHNTKLDPLILLRGQNVKRATPFYICSYRDATELFHALWIMTKSSFAKGMKYNLVISAAPRHRHVDITDTFIKYGLLPRLYSFINKIDFYDPHATPLKAGECADIISTTHKRLTLLRAELTKHLSASQDDVNLYNYNLICGLLESFMLRAETCINKRSFLKAELLLERVNFEACSMIRTRTAELVDVSDKSKEGINRVCKLIAISAYRLCELRSGSLARILAKNKEQASPSGEQSPSIGKTTRIQSEALAHELAVSNGLLALRLPCASPLHEWSIRVDIMLLRLFAERKDISYAVWAIRRIKENCSLLWKDAKSKQKLVQKISTKPPPKYQALGDLVTYLETALKPSPALLCLPTIADKCEEIVTEIWGERLTPKKGYIGLIWTF
ncbi:uncharacterized protein A1O9_08569, partial [Exophiala aquamarina CBS 119918]